MELTLHEALQHLRDVLARAPMTGTEHAVAMAAIGKIGEELAAQAAAIREVNQALGAERAAREKTLKNLMEANAEIAGLQAATG